MIRHNRPTLPGLDGPAIMQEARKLLAPRIEQPARRAFLQRTLSLGGLALLSGCSLSDNESVEQALAAVSRFNDRAQGWIFDPGQLAPTYPRSEEHTSELQSLMRISYAVFCLKKKNKQANSYILSK